MMGPLIAIQVVNVMYRKSFPSAGGVTFKTLDVLSMASQTNSNKILRAQVPPCVDPPLICDVSKTKFCVV